MGVLRTALFLIIWFAYHAVYANVNRLPDTNITAGHELRKHLFQHYHKDVIPATSKKPLQIDMNIVFNSVELSYEASHMTIYAWVKTEWNDERLTWNADEYDRIESITVDIHDIWHPDFVAYNSVGPEAAMHSRAKIIVNSTGNVLWVPPVQYTIQCRPDLTHWPHDTQTGLLKVGSWVHSDNQLNLVNTTHQILAFDSDPEWRMVHVSSEKITKLYPCCPNEPYTHVEYNVTINRETQRRHPFVILPALCVALLNLLVFWLSPDDKCKLITSLFDASIVVLILLFVYSKIPFILSSVPLIVLYYTYSLGLIVLTAIISVVVKNMTTTTKPLSKPENVIVQSRFVEFLGMTTNEATSSDNNTVYEDREINSPITEFNKKQILAKMIDKICFIVFVFIYIVLLFRLVF